VTETAYVCALCSPPDTCHVTPRRQQVHDSAAVWPVSGWGTHETGATFACRVPLPRHAELAAVQEDCVFVKRFRSHKGPIADLAVSTSGDVCATLCTDGTAKVYDVPTFDMIVMLRLKFVPGVLCFLSQRRASKRKLAVSERDCGKIWIYDVNGGGDEPQACIEDTHQAPVTAMCANPVHGTVRSANDRDAATS
jgi:WD40 repeat protein